MILSKYWGMMGRASCVLALCVLQACAIANPKGAQYTPDQTITNALASPGGSKQIDEKLGQDGRIIRDHVTQASLSDLSAYNGTAWENEATGSRGTISSIQSISENGRQCRAFKTTRESFDGILVYEGKACDTPNGGWVLSQFEAQ